MENLVTRYPVRRGLTERLAREPRLWVRAVDGVSFTVARGEMLALVGESGCGKTSTAQTILGMVNPAGGSIRLNGSDIAGLSQRQMRPLRRRLQMIYQDPYESLDPRLRVRPRSRSRCSCTASAVPAAGAATWSWAPWNGPASAPDGQFLDRYPHELSGGQRQRVAIAAALVLGPDLLLADEPVSMLDVSVRAGVLALLDELRRELRMGILMITHDLSTAAHFADRIAVMYLGRIVEFGPAAQVVTDPRHPYTKALLSVVPQRDPRHRTTPQILTGRDTGPGRRAARLPLSPALSRSPRTGCRAEDPALRPPAAVVAAGHEAACLLA